MSELTDLTTKAKTGFNALNIWAKIAIVVIAGLLIYLAVQHLRINALEKKNQLQSVELMNANDSVKSYKTKAGLLYFDINAATVDANSLRRALELSGFEIKDLRAENVSWRDIVSTLKAKLEMTGRDTIPLQNSTVQDTIHGVPAVIQIKKFDWTNHFLSLSGTIQDKFMVTDYAYKTGMTFITSTKGKSTMVTASLMDPKAVITTGASIVVTHQTHWYEKPWLWGLMGIGAGIYLGK